MFFFANRSSYLPSYKKQLCKYGRGTTIAGKSGHTQILPIKRPFMRGGIRDVPNFKLACFVFSSLSGHVRTCLTTYIWSRKGLDVTCARLPTDRVLFHAHTTHSVTEVSLSRGLVSGIAFQDTYATRISPTAASGVNSRHIGFPATGAQCGILLNCAL